MDVLILCKACLNIEWPIVIKNNSNSNIEWAFLNARTMHGGRSQFLVGVQLHQWFCFGSYLFALVIDNLTAEAQDEVC